MDVNGGNTNSHTLMELTNGEIYTISVVGTASPHGIPSVPVEAGTVALGKSKHYCEVIFAVEIATQEAFLSVQRMLYTVGEWEQPKLSTKSSKIKV